MKIAILGYGKMGKAIEKIALFRGHEIVLRINRKNTIDLNIDNLRKADVVIDFSIPESAKNNILLAIDAKKPIISGTPGWLKSYNEVVKYCTENNSTFLYASNFSLGVNLFFELNKKLAKLMKYHKEYEIDISEIHHTQKLDYPSGTAISLAEQIISENNNKIDWTIETINSSKQIKINTSW